MSIKEQVIEIVADKLGFDVISIKEDLDIVNDLGADSLDIVELAMGIEEEFKIKVPDEEIPDIKTVGDLVKKVENKIKGC